jgi:uncharacterized membrane protein (UPF0182 family)
MLAPVAATVVVLLVLLAAFASKYTDLLWYREVGRTSESPYTRVFSTLLRTKVLLFLLYAVVMAAIVGVNVWVAHRLRPPFRPQSLEQQNLDRYRLAIEPHRRLILLAGMAFMGVTAGSQGASHWQTWLLYLNRVPFGVPDEQFGKDISFFAFEYPFYRLIVGFIFSAIFFALLLSLATHYLFGGVRLQYQGEKVTPAARAHLSVLLGALAALKAVFYLLDRWGLAFSTRGSVTGASYTDVTARLPVLTVLVFAAALCAVLFVANLRSRGWLLPGVAISVLVLSSFVGGFVVPTLVQQLRVRPNEIRYEAKYIQRNIDATLRAYQLDGMEKIAYAGTGKPAERDVVDDDGSGSARLLDPNLLTPTFEQLRQQRNYYGFADGLDIDRYDGRDYVVAVREIDHGDLESSQRNWLRERLIYTHGFGFVGAPTDRLGSQGEPAFVADDAAPFEVEQPRIYFGEMAPNYSVVGDPGTKEVDALAGEEESATFTYDGKGGVTLSGVNRLLYAIRFREANLLISSAVSGKSRVLYHRDPRERVAKVAPFLELDRDPYPAVVDGRIVWIVDGYTTSAGYPYAQLVSFGRATEDTTAAARRGGERGGRVNYIRNSVKATVDAYDGTVTVYAWDEDDPVLRAWRKVFPGIVRPKGDISSALAEHFRYPEDLFKVQRDLVQRYHVTDPSTFFNERDVWSVPDDPTAQSRGIPAGPQPPYYQLLQLPGQDEPRFNLTAALTPRGQAVKTLAGFLYASSDPADYGKIRLLELPKDTQLPGPPQASNAFQSFPEASQQFTQLNAGGSKVRFGNLLTIPVRGGVVNVQPVYVESATGGAAAFPLLRKVLVGYANGVGYGDTLAEALREALTTPAGTPGGPQPGATPGATTSPTPTAPASPSPTATLPVGDTLQKAVADAVDAQRAAEAALQKDPVDWTGYGAAQERLREALQRIARLTETSPSPSPS